MADLRGVSGRLILGSTVWGLIDTALDNEGPNGRTDFGSSA